MSGIIQGDRTVTTNELSRIPAHLDVVFYKRVSMAIRE